MQTQVPNLSECEDVQYESRNYVPRVSYKTLEGEEQWTPVIKRKGRVKVRRSDEIDPGSDSSDNGSDVDVSCSRLVEYEKREGVPGLKIYRRGPATWTPVALRTRSKTSQT